MIVGPPSVFWSLVKLKAIGPPFIPSILVCEKYLLVSNKLSSNSAEPLIHFGRKSGWFRIHGEHGQVNFELLFLNHSMRNIMEIFLVSFALYLKFWVPLPKSPRSAFIVVRFRSGVAFHSTFPLQIIWDLVEILRLRFDNLDLTELITSTLWLLVLSFGSKGTGSFLSTNYGMLLFWIQSF